MTHKALLKLGRLVTADLLNGGPVRDDITVYQRGALKLHGDAPVLVDHDDTQPVGRVLELFEAPDTDGHWLWARCTIDRPPAWLKKGTKASLGYKALFRGGLREWSWIHRGLVTEASIFSPALRTAEPLAQVVLLERADSPAAVPTSDGAVIGEVIVHGGRGEKIVRYFDAEITVR